MTFHIFFFTTVLQKNTLTEAEINRKQQLKQLTDKMTDIKSSYYTQKFILYANVLKIYFKGAIPS